MATFAIRQDFNRFSPKDDSAGTQPLLWLHFALTEEVIMCVIVPVCPPLF